MSVQQLLDSVGASYVETGKNVSAGNVNVKCPFCGDEDPSEHMGISLTNGAWGCWRNQSHRGRDLAVLLCRLTNISLRAAAVLVARFGDFKYASPVVHEHESESPVIEADRWFRPIRLGTITASYAAYLVRRGFPQPEETAQRFALVAAVAGQFARRIVFKVHDRSSKLVAWTGRAIGQSDLRYLSYPQGATIKKHLLFYDLLWSEPQGTTVYITEGPFDALKLYVAGFPATCLFGLSATSDQLDKLIDLRKERGTNYTLLLDYDTDMRALDLQRKLAVVHVTRLTLGGLAKDPGDLTIAQAREFLS